jgi:steroid delta-isomerase-like uncharacterized protein
MRSLSLLLLVWCAALPAAADSRDEEARNKAVARSFFEDVLDKGKLEDYAKSHAPDFVAHTEGGRLAPLEEDIAAAKEQRKALPDMKVKVNQLVAEGDLVSVYWTASGTNTAAGWGIPATGKRVTVNGMTLFRFKDGLMREEWSVFDMMSILKQLGLLPPPPA